MARVFTRAVINVIRELASQGKTAAQIATIIGSTPGSVRVKCCRLKISLSRRGRPSLVPSFPSDNQGKLVVRMRADDYAALTRRAQQMDRSPVELAAMLLEAVASGNIFEAVLGDDE
jgi:hypothetical protein